NVTIELVATLDDALARSEQYAPEHLELLVSDPAPLLGRVRNAGTVFASTSAVVGDYAAGATHVLPTGGLARASGGLGLESFLKPLQIVRADGAGLRAAQRIVGPLARLEGLPLHAAAIDARLAETAAWRLRRQVQAHGWSAAHSCCRRTSRRMPGPRRRPRWRRARGSGRSRSSATTRTRPRFRASRRSRWRTALRG